VTKELPDLFESEKDKQQRYKRIVGILKTRHSKLESSKQPWFSLWSYVSEYVMHRERNFHAQATPGKFLTADVFSSIPAKACYKTAALIVGMIWNSSSRSFELLPPDDMPEELQQQEEIKEWYRRASKRVHRPFESLESGFVVRLTEAIHEATAYGTGGLLCFRNRKDKSTSVKFRCVNVKRSCIDENAEGIVNTIFTRYCYSVRQFVHQYGEDNVSPQVRKKYREGKSLEDLVHVVHVIEEKINTSSKASYEEDGSEDMPVSSIYYEEQTDWVIESSGFEQMPGGVFRFWKHEEEVYGRGPGTEALPDILTLNAMEETLLIGGERMVDPATWSWDDGFMGGGTINKSAGANNPLRVPTGGRTSGFTGQPMGAIFSVGDLTPQQKQAEQKKADVYDAFFLDVLQELESHRMTLGEYQMRANDRFTALVLLFLRLIAELLEPSINRVFNIELSEGTLGVVPDSPRHKAMLANGIPQSEIYMIPQPVAKLMREGYDVYKTRYLTYAARMFHQQEVQGVVAMMQDVMEVSKLNPQILDIFNWERVIKILQERRGAPEDVVKTMEQIAEMRKQKAAAESKIQSMQEAQIQAEVQKDASQAAKNAAAANALPIAKLV